MKILASFISFRIFQTVFRECLQVRSKNFREFQPQGDQASRLEYQPWTSAPGPRGVRTLLLRQFNITLEKAVPLAGILIIKETS